MSMCFSKTPALSPTGDAKPFDAAGDGTILGEGLGVVVLKRLADAERDGDRVYAVVEGGGAGGTARGGVPESRCDAGYGRADRGSRHRHPRRRRRRSCRADTGLSRRFA